MNLSDLWFGTDFFNRIGRKNIRGDELATLIAEASGGVSTSLRASLNQFGAVAIPTGTPTTVVFDNVGIDVGGWVPGDDPTNNIVVPAGVSAIVAYANGIWASGGTGWGQIEIEQNSGIFAPGAQQSVALGDTFVVKENCCGIAEVSPGDIITLQVTQTDAGNHSLTRTGLSVMAIA